METSKTHPSVLWGILGLLLCFWSCQQLDPRTEEFLEWNLHDSLQDFDSVEIVILDPKDRTLVLDSVFSGKLDSVQELLPYTLKLASGKPFSVRVRGFRMGLVAYETYYLRQGDVFRVEKVSLESLPIAHPMLNSLAASPGKITPSFSPGTLEYGLSLPFTDSTIRITASAKGTVPVTVAGDTLVAGIPGRAISVREGKDTVKVAVQSIGALATYKLYLTRARSPDARLGSLSFSDTSVSIAFNPDTLEYSITVPNSTDSLAFLPLAINPQAGITLNGIGRNVDGRFASMALTPGINKAEVTVVAPDGISRRVYAIHITRKLNTNAFLSSLTIYPGSFTKPFQRDKLLCNAIIPAGPSEIEIVAVPIDSLASVKVNNIKVKGASSVKVPLTGTLTIVYVEVAAADTNITKTYVISVSGKPSSPP